MDHSSQLSGPASHQRPPRSRWLRPAAAGASVAVLLVGSYGLGRLVSPQGSEQDTPPATRAAAARLPGAWTGRVRPLMGLLATSGCVMAPGTDGAGNPVGYEPGNAVDQDFSTAWRCPGNGRGATLRLDLGVTRAVAEVGLVAGYSKTDPRTHADRYAENNRITRVRWSFGDGTSYVQQLDGSAHHRSLQTLRIPPAETDRVSLEILDSTPGPRDTVAISELVIARAAS